MKNLFRILFFLAFCVTVNAEYNRYTVTFTNRTAVGDSNIINGAVSRWTNAPLNNSAWLSTNNPAVSATNLQRFVARNYPQFSASITNATNVLISGADFTVAINGPFGFVTTNTAASTNWHALLLPWDNQPFATNKTNDAHELVYGLNAYSSTQAFSTGAFVMRHFAARSNANLINAQLQAPMLTNASGTFTGAYLSLGAISGATITNVLNLSGVIGKLTNGWIHFAMLTNSSGWFTNPTITSPTLIGGSASNLTGSMYGPTFTRAGPGVGSAVLITNASGQTATLTLDQSDASSGAGIDFQFAGTEVWGIDVTTNAFALSGNAGNFITFEDGQVYLGDTGIPIQPLGRVFAGTYSNSVFRGTNNWNGDVAYTAAAYSSLVDRPGANTAIPIATNVTVEMSGGSAFVDIHSFEARRTGYEFTAIFSGHITNVIVNQSGSEGTAALRITTGTGANVNQTNSPAWARFRKRSGDWLLLDRSN